VRVAAIVDSRNIRGLAGSVLGVTRNPTPAGLERCLARLGFQLDSAHFSVALPRDRDRERLRRQLEENTRYADYLRRDGRVSILEGELHYQRGRIEEKLVDVLCAVETVRQAKQIADPHEETSADAVVVLSQDADLGPGIELALEFEVPVLTLAPGKVHNRGLPYVVLAEDALADLTETPAPYGQALRRKVAEAAWNPSVDSWEYRYERADDHRGVRAWLRHRHGMQGACDPVLVDGSRPGDLLDLAPIGVLPAQGNEFPVLELGEVPERATDLRRGLVIGRFRLLEVKIELESGRQVRAYAPNSHLTPGTLVLVQALPSNHGEHFRYIGAIDDPLPLQACGGVTMDAVSVIVQIVGHNKGNAFGSCAVPQIDVFIPGGAARTEIGARYLVSLVGSGRHPNSAFVGHLASSRLP